MGFKPLTVNTPVEEEAHILAEDDATLYDTIIGSDCVLPVGGQLNASIISNNSVRITDGMVSVGGHIGRIIKGDYEDMAIANGVSGQNRNDLIVARFISGGTAGADTYSLVVVQGTPGTSASDPATVQGVLYDGDTQRDYPLWRVRLEGLSIAGLDKLYTVGTMLKGKVNVADIVDNLTTDSANKPLSAKQGKALSDRIGPLASLATSVKTSIVNAINSLKSVVDTKLNIANVLNNLTTTASGYALDARQGKALNDKITTANNNISAINKKIADSGWVNCTIGANLTAVSGETPQVRKIGNTVYLRGAVTCKTNWEEHASFLTIPSGYRPSIPNRFILWGYGTFRYTLTVNANGVCIANHLTNDQYGNFASQSGNQLRFNCSWLIG